MPRTDEVEIFCSYSHADQELRDELFGHLDLLRRSGIIKTWYDGQIAPGQDWRSEIEKHLRSSKVILLLVSVDLLKSEFVQSIELPLALKRHSAHDALVIPVLLRPVAWNFSGLSALEGLPDGLRPVVEWTPRDLAWVSVCEGLVRAILVWGGPSEAPIDEPWPAAAASSMRRRVLDIGLPHRVPVGLSTVLAVMVRRPQSAGLAGLLDLEASYGLKPEEVKFSQSFPVAFPRSADGSLKPAELAIVIETSDFSYSSASKALWVPPRGDSDICVFLLTPLRTGTLRVNVDLQYQGKRVAGCLLASSSLAQVGYEPAVQASIGLGPANLPPSTSDSAPVAELAAPMAPAPPQRPTYTPSQTQSPPPPSGYPAQPRRRMTEFKPGGSAVPSQHDVPSPDKGAGRRIVGVLVTYTWKPEGQIFPVREGRNLIGRDDGQCEIAIPQDTTLSAVNSHITYRKSFVVGDMVSMSGTDVNGEPIEQQFRPLPNYATIRTGSTYWTFLQIDTGSGERVGRI